MNVQRLNELDGLRGIAALAVVLYHYFYHFNQLYNHQFVVSEYFKLGWHGVQLFFIVSGFVIYWTVSRSNRPLDFVWSRFSRLYPTYWVAILLTFFVVSLFSLPGREVSIIELFLNFMMFHEYMDISHVDGVYWTLTLELAFYFWILIIFCAGQIKNIERFFIFWVISASIITFHKFNIPIEPWLKKLLLLDYIEFFSAGICFYKYKFKESSIETNILMLCSTLALFASNPNNVALYLCGFYVLFGLIITQKANFLKWRLFVYLGTVSYSLYLIHQNIGYVIIREFYALNLSPFWGIITAIAFSLLLSHLLVKHIERPSLKILRKYYEKNFKR